MTNTCLISANNVLFVCLHNSSVLAKEYVKLSQKKKNSEKVCFILSNTFPIHIQMCLLSKQKNKTKNCQQKKILSNNS